MMFLLPAFRVCGLALAGVFWLGSLLCGQEPAAGGQAGAGSPGFGALFDDRRVWSMTADEVESAWRDAGFRWISAEVRDRGVIRERGSSETPVARLAIGSLPLQEVVFGMRNGRLSEVTLIAWNKGDAMDPRISEADFKSIIEAWTAEISRRMGVRPEDRGRDSASAARAERRMWVGRECLVQLEFSGGRERVRDPRSGRVATRFQAEFIRLRVLPRPASLVGLEASTGGQTKVTRADLARRVVREESGDVFIPDIPMVDQGDKGYCAVATAARVLNYYGVPADQHEMAQLAGSLSGDGGTSADGMEDAMRRISGKYRTRFQCLLELDYSSRKYQSFMRRYNSAARKLGKRTLDNDRFIYLIEGLDPEVLREVHGGGPAYDKFTKTVRGAIDRGVPLMWALQLGLFPETGLAARQLSGGHMRLIIGYNAAKDEILFSDSWGAGHERKRMAGRDAAAATMGLYLLQPSQ